MAITQERLIAMVDLAEKYTEVLRALRAETAHIAGLIHRAETPEVRDQWIESLVNLILSTEVSIDDYFMIREEKIHFKFARNKNKKNAEHTRRWRARKREEREAVLDNYTADVEVDELFGSKLGGKPLD